MQSRLAANIGEALRGGADEDEEIDMGDAGYTPEDGCGEENRVSVYTEGV